MPRHLPALLFLSACSSGGANDTGNSCQSFCGCPEEVRYDFTTTIWNGQTDEPVEGATLTCFTEDSPRGTSDAEGVIAFQLDTTESPGCGVETCGQMTVAAENSALVSQILGFYQVYEKVVTLEYGEN